MSDFTAIYQEYEQAFRHHLLEKLYDLSPSEFERFAQKLLSAYGFTHIRVTQASKDGGIDGDGALQLGLAAMKAAFQCKRWRGNVGRVEVDKFRGAIQGEFEQGIFFTTGDYTETAKTASIKKGAVPIILLNGDSIVDLMLEKELGVERVPLYIYRELLGDFMVEEGTPTTRPVPLPVKKSVPKASYTGKAITAFTWNGDRYEVSSWAQMLEKVCQLMAEKHKADFDRVLRLVGRKRPYFTPNPEELRSSLLIQGTGIFVEKNLNVSMIISLSQKVLALFGYTEDPLSFETQEKN